MKKSIDTRMKEDYEFPFRRHLIRRIPVIVRVDGRHFHTLTRKIDKPFDTEFQKLMIYAAQYLAKEISGFKLGYVASDEASFMITDYETLETEAWFGYCINKVETTCASVMSVAFNHILAQSDKLKHLWNCLPTFDARAFNIPENEVPNYFIWRFLDWKRNAVSMAASSLFSQKQLQNKSIVKLLAMIKQKTGKTFDQTYDDNSKFGTFLVYPKFSPENWENPDYAFIQKKIIDISLTI